MHNHHNRVITIDKNQLITTILENKNNHIKDYKEAVKAYKIEAKKQLQQATQDLKDGKLKIKLNLITPVDRSLDYDKVVEMFKWEQKDSIEITQKEFNEYVLDETQEALQAKMLNSSYR